MKKILPLPFLFLALSAQNLQSSSQRVQGLPTGYGDPVQVTIVGGASGGQSDGLTNTELRASPLNVLGPLTNTELRATPVPVSGTVSVGTVPVTGTFYQATQPVSIASMPTTPVTGTFWQTTQPVSGTFWQATQPVSGTVTITPPTLTKGTQGATGLSTQDLKDAGRTTLAMTAEFPFAQTAETLLTMTLSANGAATSTFSSRVITSAKRFRIQSAILEVEALGSGTAPQRAYLRLRSNSAGATTTSSPIQLILSAGTSTAVVKGSSVSTLNIPDGFELLGNGTVTFGFSLETPDYTATTATGQAKITVVGYEY
jgi:hypothetical protein